MYHALLRQLREELRAYVDQAVLRVFVSGRYSRSSETGGEDGMEGRPTEGADEPNAQNNPDLPGRRLQHFGFRSRPPKGVWTIKVGPPTNAAIVAEDSERYGPDDLEDGEACLYNKVTGTTIRLDKDGNVKIDAASGKDVIVNGGTLRVARKTDPVKVTIPALTFLTAATGGVKNPDPVVVDGYIDDGAEHFKG